MTKRVIKLFTMVLLCLWAAVPVLAAEKSMTFSYKLTVDGKEKVEVKTGDIITVTLKLKRTDSESPYMMYAMQDEIRYDSTFFELVENSQILNTGIETTDISKADSFREFYMNYLSMSGGMQWQGETVVGSFQLRVKADSGVTKISNQDYLVSLQDGFDSYPCEANELTVILSTDCQIRFVSNGGSEISDQTVQYGEKIVRPEDPVRKGFKFAGWYTDINLSDEWDFEQDVVQSNMSLYAKWEKTENIESSLDTHSEIVWFFLGLLLILVVYIILRNKKSANRKI